MLVLLVGLGKLGELDDEICSVLLKFLGFVLRSSGSSIIEKMNLVTMSIKLFRLFSEILAFDWW